MYGWIGVFNFTFWVKKKRREIFFLIIWRYKIGIFFFFNFAWLLFRVSWILMIRNLWNLISLSCYSMCPVSYLFLFFFFYQKVFFLISVLLLGFWWPCRILNFKILIWCMIIWQFIGFQMQVARCSSILEIRNLFLYF